LPNESRVIVCPNPRCRRKVEEPVLLNSLSTTQVEQYYACPFCFTKLDVDVENAQPQREKEREEKEELTVKPPEKEEKGPSECPQHFGYLASRPKNDPIPQECLTCLKIVDCMLKLSGAQ